MSRKLWSLFLVLATPCFGQDVIRPPIGIIPVPPLPPPRIEVRAADVGPMQTREMSVYAQINGLYAVVETTLVFHNPNPRELEGELIFPLPDGAAVCGYALDIGGVLVDGVVVTKERARVAFETETRRQVDPGLVEHVQGNLYRTRIYPLPANGQRRIRLSYTTPLVTAPNGDAALSLPMPRETIANLQVKIEVQAAAAVKPELGGLGDARFEKADNIWRVESTNTNATPGEDILVAIPRLPAAFLMIEQDADNKTWFMLTDLAPATKETSNTTLKLVHILWDASGSRAGADLKTELALLAHIEAEAFRLTVFRDTPEPTQEFASRADLITAIKQAPFDGGTDLAALAKTLQDNPPPDAATRTLLFSDGMDTLSGEPLTFDGVPPMTIVSQTVANREALRQACAGALIDLQVTDAAAAWVAIRTPPGRVAGLKGTGVAHVQGIGRPAQGRIRLLGQLTDPEATVRIVYADGSLSEPFVLRQEDAQPGRVLSTAWASARVNQLTPRADDFEEELLTLGRSHGLVSPVTSLIVLETLDQWVRHEIEPPASLPEMRRQWQQAMKGRPSQGSTDNHQRLEHVVQLWQQRVEWWKTDFSNVKNEPTPKDGGDRAPGQRGFFRSLGRSRVAESTDVAVTRPGSVFFADHMTVDASVDGDFGVAGGHPAAAAPRAMMRMGGGGGDAFAALPEEGKSQAEEAPGSSIQIKPWQPDTPYLKTIHKAKADARYAAYLAQRPDWHTSPAFFLDCAELFFQAGDDMHGRRILSNLAELRIEDSALLRVLAWRLQQVGDLDRAIVILRRVARLRPEEPQSFRDLALALAERGRKQNSQVDLTEAMQLFLRVAYGTWNRHGDSIAIFALEELNAIIAGIERQEWPAAAKPEIPAYDQRLRDNLDTDIRIVMSWDADATDIDLHVVEPGGEEAFYSHNRTRRGGLVSQDVTDGYGPEEYLIRIAPAGKYTVKAKYYGSRQQTLVGPATVSAAIFTNWGRQNEVRQNLTIRLDKPDQMIELGSITFGRGDLLTESVNLRVGMSRSQIIAILGEPADSTANPLQYKAGPRGLHVFLDQEDSLLRVVEILPGGTETILLQ